MTLTLEANNLHIVKLWVDALFAVHDPDICEEPHRWHDDTGHKGATCGRQVSKS
jgi:hypothetical protein